MTNIFNNDVLGDELGMTITIIQLNGAVKTHSLSLSLSLSLSIATVAAV